MFRNAFSFEGRIRRTEYGISYIIYIALAVLIALVSDPREGPTFLAIAFIPMIWFLLAQGAKRCHDLGKSGWFQIIPFYSLWMLFANSDYGENRYGKNPKGVGNDDTGEAIYQATE